MDLKYSQTLCKYENTLPGNAGCFTVKEVFGRSDKTSPMGRLPKSTMNVALLRIKANFRTAFLCCWYGVVSLQRLSSKELQELVIVNFSKQDLSILYSSFRIYFKAV